MRRWLCPVSVLPARRVLSDRQCCLSGNQFCLVRALANFVSRIRWPHYLHCLFPLLCHKMMLPANFLPASGSFVDTASVRSANSASLPRFAATFASQTATSACHFCLLWWSRDPFRPTDSRHCRTNSVCSLLLTAH